MQWLSNGHWLFFFFFFNLFLIFYYAVFFAVPGLQRRKEEFQRYMREKLSVGKSNFRKLLQETRIITHKSRRLCEKSEHHFKEITEILKVSWNLRSVHHWHFVPKCRPFVCFPHVCLLIVYSCFFLLSSHPPLSLFDICTILPPFFFYSKFTRAHTLYISTCMRTHTHTHTHCQVPSSMKISQDIGK